MVAKGALREEADNERCRVISSCEAVRASDSPSNICAVVASEDEEDEEGGKESNPIIDPSRSVVRAARFPPPPTQRRLIHADADAPSACF